MVYTRVYMSERAFMCVYYIVLYFISTQISRYCTQLEIMITMSIKIIMYLYTRLKPMTRMIYTYTYTCTYTCTLFYRNHDSSKQN